jgi:hypothetical protein
MNELMVAIGLIAGGLDRGPLARTNPPVRRAGGEFAYDYGIEDL